MKTRQEIKLRAKQVFFEKYWLCVGVNAVVMALIGVTGSTVVGALILSGPLSVGLAMFSLNLYRGMDADFDTLFTGGFKDFGRNLGGMLWMQLFVFLWSLLFIVPGIIKSLSYAMTPYILADCPNVKAQDALKISMKMMDGHKWELFVFYLSYFGWMLLSGLTLGILSVFYVSPYMSNSIAGYYSELKVLALEKGIVTPEEMA